MEECRAVPSEPETQPILSRRSLLAGAAAAGAAGVLAQVPGAGAAAPKGGDGKGKRKLPAVTFFEEPGLNFQMLFALGGAPYGASEVGEVLATFDRIHGKGDKLSAVYEEFLRLGRQVRASADRQRNAGRRESACRAYLRATMYLDQALFYALASDKPTRLHEGALYREMEATWASAGALFRPRFEPVRIPRKGGDLPGWFLSPGPGKRPTAILNTGSDAQNIDMWVYGGAAALERGWNALIFEGPGQGASLFLRNQPFVPDWETVIVPVVDWLRAHPKVDRKRISLIGQSFGGYLIVRAATREHRLAALAADPGVHDCFVDWRQGGLPPEFWKAFDAGNRNEANAIWDSLPKYLNEYGKFGLVKRSEIYGNGGGYEKLKLAQRFVLSEEEARMVTTPTALLSPQLEQFFPGQPETVHSWLRAPSTLIEFTVAEGGEYHCEPMAPQLRNERVFDWLETHARPPA
jgi:pimeloyl-ACP methyl ester carboxylesterase